MMERNSAHQYDSSAAEATLKATLKMSSSYRKAQDVIHIQGSSRRETIDISFQRTIRVPDNNDTSELPPSMGTFPLYSVTKYHDRLPTDMVNKGGLFFPMYRTSISRIALSTGLTFEPEREAMWINFRAEKPFAVKIYIGGVNAVSGEPIQENAATALRRFAKFSSNKLIQDYVVPPRQLWLDGIASHDERVRQFVAMPLGSGYSVEAQVTKNEVVGGLQFLVVPSENTRRISQLNRPKGSMRICIKTLTGKTIALSQLTGHETIIDLKDMIEDEEGTPANQQRLIHGGKQLEDEETLLSYNITDGSTLHLIVRLRGGGATEPGAELGIAPGGLIKQCIIEDNYPPSTWEPDRSISFNVQILNSELFHQLTGFAPPDTPITAETYAEQGLPFYKFYEEEHSTIKGDFAGISSVKAVDKAKAKSGQQDNRRDEDEPSYANPLILLDKNASIHFRPVKEMKDELRGARHAQF